MTAGERVRRNCGGRSDWTSSAAPWTTVRTALETCECDDYEHNLSLIQHLKRFLRALCEDPSLKS